MPQHISERQEAVVSHRAAQGGWKRPMPTESSGYEGQVAGQEGRAAHRRDWWRLHESTNPTGQAHLACSCRRHEVPTVELGVSPQAL